MTLPPPQSNREPVSPPRRLMWPLTMDKETFVSLMLYECTMLSWCKREPLPSHWSASPMRNSFQAPPFGVDGLREAACLGGEGTIGRKRTWWPTPWQELATAKRKPPCPASAAWRRAQTWVSPPPHVAQHPQRRRQYQHGPVQKGARCALGRRPPPPTPPGDVLEGRVGCFTPQAARAAAGMSSNMAFAASARRWSCVGELLLVVAYFLPQVFLWAQSVELRCDRHAEQQVGKPR